MIKPFLFVDLAYLRSHIHPELFLRSYIKVETFLRSHIKVVEHQVRKGEILCTQLRNMVLLQASGSLSTGGRREASGKEFRRHCDFNIASMKLPR